MTFWGHSRGEKCQNDTFGSFGLDSCKFGVHVEEALSLMLGVVDVIKTWSKVSKTVKSVVFIITCQSLT